MKAKESFWKHILNIFLCYLESLVCNVLAWISLHPEFLTEDIVEVVNFEVDFKGDLAAQTAQLKTLTSTESGASQPPNSISGKFLDPQLCTRRSTAGVVVADGRDILRWFLSAAKQSCLEMCLQSLHHAARLVMAFAAGSEHRRTIFSQPCSAWLFLKTGKQKVINSTGCVTVSV